MPPKKCYVCDSDIDEYEGYVQMLDGRFIRKECFEKVQDPNNPKMTGQLLRSKIELLKKGDMEGLAKMMSQEGPDQNKLKKMEEDFQAKREAALEKAAENKRIADEEAAAEEARLQACKDAVAAKNAAFQAAKEKEEADAIAAEQAKHDKFKSKPVWTLAELQDPKLLEEYHVDHCAKNEKGENNKEALLSDEEFMTVFGVDKEKFEGLAGWKKKDAKKKNKIF